MSDVECFGAAVVDASGLPSFPVVCNGCGESYRLLPFVYLEPVCYARSDGSMIAPGEKPVLEVRKCKCGACVSASAGDANPSVPFYKNL